MLKKPNNIPTEAGCYLFKDANGKVIYVGKAKNLKNRVTSYFSSNLLPKTKQMVRGAESISFVKVRNEFEALLLEANLVKKYNPKYNVELKDGKSPLYIGITDDYYPRIITFRKPEMGKLKLKTYFGPFLSGLMARKILNRVRHVFPFATHYPTKRICIYSQIGLCNPCPSKIEKTDDLSFKKELRKNYLRKVRNIKMLLGGNVNLVGRVLEKEMREYSDQEKFEKAREISLQIRALENITKSEDVEGYIENPNFLEDIRQRELRDLKNILSRYFTCRKLSRIECFDIAHFAGAGTTASMVTFINGEADKKYYRHFKMYNMEKSSDVSSMREVLERRLKYLEDPSAALRTGWGVPDLIIVDGGKPQVSIAMEVLEEMNLTNIPLVGLAKRYETIVLKKNNSFVEIRVNGEALKLLQRIRDEAHRFARRLHHKQVKKSLLW